MDEETDEAAMASMMGFSSFGGPDRPSKKRRYNPDADAAIDSLAQTNAATTGSNSTPLGSRKQTDGKNADEIDLEDEGGGMGEGELAFGSSGVAHPASLPQRPATVESNGAQDLHRTARNYPWYEGYYDELSNRNPWEKLEKSIGLQPRGTWLSRPEKATTDGNPT